MTFVDPYLTGDDKSTWLVWLIYLAILIGIYKIACWILSPLFACAKHFCCRCRQDLNAKYGRRDRSSWAVVTGGSDGIGLEMCHQLADQGFNICIMSRSKDKIDSKLLEIKEKYPTCDTLAIQSDFSTMTSMQEYRDLV